MSTIEFRTKRIFLKFHILKTNRMMSFCNLFMKRPSYNTELIEKSVWCKDRWLITQFAGGQQHYWTPPHLSHHCAAGQVRRGSRCRASSTDGIRRRCGCETTSCRGSGGDCVVGCQRMATYLSTVTSSKAEVFSTILSSAPLASAK